MPEVARDSGARHCDRGSCGLDVLGAVSRTVDRALRDFDLRGFDRDL
jgi:hypothetical protein